MKNSLSGKRICVTGGDGFLGQRVVAELSARGHNDVFVGRHRDYDLVRAEDCERLYHDAKPQVVIHLAGVVGGIGANRENPGRFFYDNLDISRAGGLLGFHSRTDFTDGLRLTVEWYKTKE